MKIHLHSLWLRFARNDGCRYMVGIITILFLVSGCTSLDVANKDSNKKAAGFNVQLGLGYMEQGQMERAKQKLTLALSQTPHWPPALDAMAFYAEKTGDMEAAKQYYRRSLEIAPNDGSVQNNYGAFLCRNGYLSEAESHFLRAIQDKTYLATAETYENAGLCALKIPDQKKAISYFEKALLHSPTRAKTILELGNLNYKLGHYQVILNSIQRYLDIIIKEGEKSDADVVQLGVRVAKRLNDKRALAYYQSLLHEGETS